MQDGIVTIPFAFLRKRAYVEKRFRVNKIIQEKNIDTWRIKEYIKCTRSDNTLKVEVLSVAEHVLKADAADMYKIINDWQYVMILKPSAYILLNICTGGFFNGRKKNNKSAQAWYDA